MDRMQECNTGWRKERGRHSKVYKIIWSSSAFLCTVRLCSSIPLHPPPHQVLDQELRWLSLCCLACRHICLPLVILTAVGCFFSLFTPGMMSHVMKCSCEFVLWMLSLFLLKEWTLFYLPCLRGQVFLCHCGTFYTRKPGSRVFFLDRKKASQKRWILVCYLISVRTVLKECVSLLSLHLQVCGSFQVSQGTGGWTWCQSQGVYQCLHQELWGWYGWWAAEGAFRQIW